MRKILTFDYDDPQDLRRSKIFESSEELLFAINDYSAWLSKKGADEPEGYCYQVCLDALKDFLKERDLLALLV